MVWVEWVGGVAPGPGPDPKRQAVAEHGQREGNGEHSNRSRRRSPVRSGRFAPLSSDSDSPHVRRVRCR